MGTEPTVNRGWYRTSLLPVVLAVLAGLSPCTFIVGCGEADLPPGLVKKSVDIEKVPEVSRKAARKAFPKVEFKEAWENIDPQGKLHSYEIRGRQASDGKIQEVRVSAAGEILESE